MPGIDRNAFMARIRAGLARAQGDIPAPPEVDDALVRLCPADAPCLERFVESARAAGMEVAVVDAAALPDEVRGRLVASGATRVSVSVADVELRGILESATRAAGCARVDDGGGMSPLFDADVGLTDVDAAVAETGSIVLSSAGQRSRGAHLVPPVHIAVVREVDIVADLVDLCTSSTFRGSVGQRSNHVLITGPSKTADIEGILVTGVHGPKSVHILVVRRS